MLYLNRLLSVTVFLSCTLAWSCHPEGSREVVPPAKQSGDWGQLVDLKETGLSLRVPAEWAVHKQEQLNPATGIATTLLTNGTLSKESFQHGRGDAIHIVARRCKAEQYQASLRSGARELFGQEHAHLIRELRPGEASMPFPEGVGYEVEFEGETGDSLVVSRAFHYKAFDGERCFRLTLENRRDAFMEKRAEYAAIARSIEFFPEE